MLHPAGCLFSIHSNQCCKAAAQTQDGDKRGCDEPGCHVATRAQTHVRWGGKQVGAGPSGGGKIRPAVSEGRTDPPPS